MKQVVDAFRSCWKALLLQDEAYRDIRDAPDPFVRGLTVLIVIAILTSLAAVVGEVLAWATSPSLDAVRNVVWQNMQKMPWYQEFSDDIRYIERFRYQFDLAWQIFPRLFGAPDLWGAAVGVVTRPIFLLVSWFVYGLLAHLAARIFGGQATVGQTLGCTALAISPQLLNFVHLLPYVQIRAVVAIWTLICGYMALKNAHRLSWPRTFWATILPLAVMGIIMLLLAGSALAFGIAIFAQGG